MKNRLIAAMFCLSACLLAPVRAQDAPADAPSAEERAQAARERKAAAHAFKWEKSYKRALAAARETGLPIAVLFTGTSWCGYCVQLENNVLSKPEFKEKMKGVAVGYKVALPSPGQYADKKDAKLAAKLGMRGGVPCLILLSPDEKTLGSIVGCAPGASPENYSAEIKRRAGK